MGDKATLGSGNQVCSIVETVAFNTTSNIQSNTNYGLAFNLSQFVRASAIAPNFKEYKAAKVSWILEPLYNTFQEGTTGGVSLPYVYEIMNRTQDAEQLSLVELQAAGARPKRFARTHTTTYKPNWCAPGMLSLQYGNALTNVVSTGTTTKYGWLASPNFPASGPAPGGGQQVRTIFPPSELPAPGGVSPSMASDAAQCALYNGHDLYIDQFTTANPAPIAKLTCRVTWLFRGSAYRDTTPRDDVTAITVQKVDTPQLP